MGSAALSQSDRAPSDAPRLTVYLSVGLLAGAVIALQISIMRVFAVGSWSHFGSLVVSLAMLGFGLASVVIFIAKAWFERHWSGAATAALILFGPLTVASNLIAQQMPFNAVFLVSDPVQKWRLLANFLLYLLPFLAGAFFLGIVFLKSRARFGRVYFADLTGSGASGLVVLAAMYVFAPENLLVIPLLLWAFSAIFWVSRSASLRMMLMVAAVALLSLIGYAYLPLLIAVPRIATTQYKGVSYARNFPDAQRIYRSISPFGDLQVYSSSYMHFAPGLSDNAAFNIPEIPANTYVGMYIDGDGPHGIMRNLPDADVAYFHFLPMFYPYVLKKAPRTFVVQFGGGISTMTALRSGSKSVTVAESNPAVLQAFRDPRLQTPSGDILADPKMHVIDYDGRLYLAHTRNRYDVIDLSLADSTGLSNPGGFAIVEKYSYTQEAMLSYMRALADGGILSVTLWNKEEPPKSILKLYTTMVAAAHAFNFEETANSFFVVSSYLSTTTVLYKKGGFSADEIAKLRAHTRTMSFDEIYYPGSRYDTTQTDSILASYRDAIFGKRFSESVGLADNVAPDQPSSSIADSDNPALTDATAAEPGNVGSSILPATTIGRLAWHYLIHGGWNDIAARYVFDTRPLTNDRPYFAAYVRTGDLPRTLDRLDLLQDDWGYLLLWATLAVAVITAASLILIPVAFGWRLIFGRTPGKSQTILYFACLGLGYIMVEVGLISRFTLALSNPTVSASILITGMLVFSGLGSLLSERMFDHARMILPVICVGIAISLFGYGYLLDPVLNWIGAYDYPLRLLFCFILIAPPAFLMGFPMATGMTWLTRLGKDHMFVWAWGINGCFSVIGAAAVPIIATGFGIAAVLQASSIAYLIAIPAFFGILLPRPRSSLAST